MIRELDCRGQRCPMPVIELARMFAQLEIGETVAVASTDPAARIDLVAWCRMREQEYAGEDLAPDGVPRFLVRRLT